MDEPIMPMPVADAPPHATMAMTAEKIKADKIAAEKAMAEKEKADREHGDKLLGDMTAGVGDKLHHMAADMDIEFAKLHSAYIDMPDEIKAHTLYKPMGEHIAAVEALLITLKHTAASFPMPEDGHDKTVPWHPAPLVPGAPMPGAPIGPVPVTK